MSFPSVDAAGWVAKDTPGNINPSINKSIKIHGFGDDKRLFGDKIHLGNTTPKSRKILMFGKCFPLVDAADWGCQLECSSIDVLLHDLIKMYI